MTRIAIPVFDGVTALDAVGPYEVLSRLPGATVTFLAGATGAGAVRTEDGMLGLVADRSLADLPDPDVLVVPGGRRIRALLGDEATLGWRRAADAGSTWTTSVCTGSLLLAGGIADEETARAIQLSIEYDPDPPFDAGSVGKAGPELVARVRRAADPVSPA